MKLFYWDKVLTDWTSGIMVAVAETTDEARAALLKECDYIPPEDLAKEPKIFELTEARGFVCWGSS